MSFFETQCETQWNTLINIIENNTIFLLVLIYKIKNFSWCFADNSKFNAQIPAAISPGSSQWSLHTSLQHFQNLRLQGDRVHSGHCISEWEGMIFFHHFWQQRTQFREMYEHTAWFPMMCDVNCAKLKHCFIFYINLFVNYVHFFICLFVCLCICPWRLTYSQQIWIDNYLCKDEYARIRRI